MTGRWPPGKSKRTTGPGGKNIFVENLSDFGLGRTYRYVRFSLGAGMEARPGWNRPEKKPICAAATAGMGNPRSAE